MTRLLSQLIMASALTGSTALATEKPNIIVFYTDDHGHADLSCQGVVDDIRTPHVDELASSGVRARHGYSTAPQCVPSRAGLLIGKFQSRFGVEANGYDLAGFNRELTIAERLQDAGYATAQFGKWHLGTTPKIVEHGFQHVFAQNAGRPFSANITLDGVDREMSNLPPELYHIDGCSRAATSIVSRYKNAPFFLYVAYRAPHVPLDAPRKYLDRFPGEMPERRRQALAMLSAVDDGVGLIMETLKKHDLTEKTLVFYIGDNGAPLKIHKHDALGGGPGWDGSLNDPLNGEKGMLAEGGMHVPFVVSWPGTIPSGQVYDHPITALDVAATVAEVCQLKTKRGDMDGVNLIPYLTGALQSPPHQRLMWRWLSQTAIREGDWKLLRGAGREYLFNLGSDLPERRNLLTKHPDIANRLRAHLSSWTNQLSPPGMTVGGNSLAATSYYDYYMDGKPPAPLRAKHKNPQDPSGKQRQDIRSGLPAGWVIRGGTIRRRDEHFIVTPNAREQSSSPFLARNGLNIAPPVDVQLMVRSSTPAPIIVSWRTSDETTFQSKNQVAIDFDQTNEWSHIRTTIDETKRIVHIRVQLPIGATSIKSLQLKPANSPAISFGDASSD